MRKLYRIVFAAIFAALACSVAVHAEDPKFQAVSDVVYKTVGERQIKLNIYLPLKDGQTVKGAPLLIFINSGCWYSDNQGDGWFWRNIHAYERGFAVASVGHRSISEAPFPAALEDVRAAVRFLRKHADEYGYDPDRFAVAGFSSGGNLALSLGISDEKSPFNVGDNLDVSGQVQRVVDFYGPSDFVSIFERYPRQALDCIYQAVGMPRESGEKENAQNAELMKRAALYSPITYVDSNYAPTLILHGTCDTAVPISQSALMYEKLLVFGVKARFLPSDGGVHDCATLFPLAYVEREVFDFLNW